MKNKYRIFIETTAGGDVTYYPQYREYLFFWRCFYEYLGLGVSRVIYFNTLQNAQDYIDAVEMTTTVKEQTRKNKQVVKKEYWYE
jgi:hypothetical protein